MYLCLHKLRPQYGKIIHCIKPKENLSHRFLHSFISRFSYVSNASNLFILKTGLFLKTLLPRCWFSSIACPFYSLYMQIYLLNTCKLNWEENVFDFYLESVAYFNLIINSNCLFNNNMRIGTYLDQTQAIL